MTFKIGDVVTWDTSKAVYLIPTGAVIAKAHKAMLVVEVNTFIEYTNLVVADYTTGEILVRLPSLPENQPDNDRDKWWSELFIKDAFLTAARKANICKTKAKRRSK